MNVAEAIASRRSVRDFLPDPVPLSLVTRILAEAGRAPSGSNLQPWRVHVLAGASRDRLVGAVHEAMEHSPRGQSPDHQIHPETMSPLEQARYKRAAELVYGAAGIDRDDMTARIGHLARSWSFFGAPVGLVFTVERRLQPGQWADIGMYMQNVMLLALEYGIASCAQEAWALWGGLVRDVLGLDADHIVYSGMALGHPRVDAPINCFRSERAVLDEYVTIYEE